MEEYNRNETDTHRETYDVDICRPVCR